MTKTFNCASCSAPLEFEGTTIQKCRYCGSSVITPPELFYSTSAAPFGDLSSLTGKALKIAEIDQLIHDGRKIEAIKLFRETFGLGLAEAKDAVERMERGESVDISGMRVGSSRRATPQDIEAVKKIGYTIGGSILVTVVASVLIIGAVVAGIFYFAWKAVDSKLPVAMNTKASSTPVPPPAQSTPSPDMTEILKTGGEGTGAGFFTDNRHVAVDGRGRIYSSNYSPHRIQVFDADGKFLNQWGPATGSNLYDLAADREGNVYVVNDKGIFKHEGESGKLLSKLENVRPRGVALTWNGKLIAAVGRSLVVLDTALRVVNEFKDAAERADSAFGFEKLTTDGSGFVYALDSHNGDICKFSAEGKFLSRFPSGARFAHALAVDPRGRLFVSETSWIWVMDTNGQALRKVNAFQAFGITFDQSGSLFIAARPHVLKQKLNF
jgi:hypothetical protein